MLGVNSLFFLLTVFVMEKIIPCAHNPSDCAGGCAWGLCRVFFCDFWRIFGGDLEAFYAVLEDFVEKCKGNFSSRKFV